jgi:hypothetical protein
VVRPGRTVELTDGQIEALLSAADIGEAAWWDDPMLQRRLAALARARRTLIDAQHRPPHVERGRVRRAPRDRRGSAPPARITTPERRNP